MRSMFSLVCAGVMCVGLAGCGAEAKKVPEVKVEDKAKLDQQHAAVQSAIKDGKDPGQALVSPAATGAPTSGGHGR